MFASNFMISFGTRKYFMQVLAIFSFSNIRTLKMNVKYNVHALLYTIDNHGLSCPVCCFLRQGTLLHFVSLRLGVWMGTSDMLLGDWPCDGLASHLGGSSTNTPRHASCLRNWDKLRPFGPLAHLCFYLFT